MTRTRACIRWLLIYLGVWLLVITLFTGETLIGGETEWPRAFVHSLSRWSAWIVLAPAVIVLATRFPLTRPRDWLTHGLVHLAASVAMALLAHAMFETLFKESLPRVLLSRESLAPAMVWEEMGRRPPPVHPGERDGPPPPPNGRPLPGRSVPRHGPPPPEGHPPEGPPSDVRRSLLKEAARQLPFSLPVYWAIVGIQSVLLFGRQLRRREQQSLELQARLTRAKLEALKLQLQPHFLFNALNAISTLIHRDPEKADVMIGHLSTLFRGVLEEREAQEVTLERELQLLHAYVSIEQVRFGDRIQFEQRIDPDCNACKVPTLLLQPLVENAVRHGLEPLKTGGHLWLSAVRADRRLVLRIEDDGVGRGLDTSGSGWGIGLTNTQARLATLYGAEGHRFELSDRKEGGTLVTIELPFQTAS